MFRGIHALNLDDKGRMSIPSRYRDGLKDDCAGQLVMTIDTEDRCLLLYPLADWLVIEEKIVALPSFNPAARRIQRLLIGHASDTEMDGQGRLLLSPLLREYANLEKHIVLVGQGKKFEIWDETHWQVSREKWLAEQLEEGIPEELQTLSL